MISMQTVMEFFSKENVKMFKPFFVHYNGGTHISVKSWKEKYNKKYWGFTAFIEPVEDNDREVYIRTTFCSTKDKFSRAEGRIQCLSKPRSVRANKRDVPRIMAELRCQLYNDQWAISDQTYYYLYRNFI